MNRTGATTMEHGTSGSLREVTLRPSVIHGTCMFVAERLHERCRGKRQFSSGPVAPGRYRARFAAGLA